MTAPGDNRRSHRPVSNGRLGTLRHWFCLALSLTLCAWTFPAIAQAPASLNTREADRPAYPAVLPLRDQAKLHDAWLKERLETIILGRLPPRASCHEMRRGEALTNT